MSRSPESTKEDVTLRPRSSDLSFREEVSEDVSNEEESSDSDDSANEYQQQSGNEEESEEELEEDCEEEMREMVSGLLDGCQPSSSADIPSYLIRKAYTPKRSLPLRGSAEYKEIRRSDAKLRMQRNNDAHCCPHCDYTAPFPSKIKLHIETNHTSGRHPCGFCSQSFDTKNEQRKHVSVAHPLVHACDHCNHGFKTRHEVRRHIRTNHELGVKCTVRGCNEIVLKRRLKRHLLEKHSTSIEIKTRKVLRRTRVRCTQCEYSSLEQEDMEKHVESVHGDGIKCPFQDCEAKIRLPDLDAHLASEHASSGDNINSSEGQMAASETVTSSSGVDLEDLLVPLDEDLDETMTMNDNQPKPARKSLVVRNAMGGYACTTCDSNYDSLYLLKKHIKRVHEKAYAEVKKKRVYGQYACTWEGCDKTCRTPGDLDDHLNVHKNVFPYQCSHCSQSFQARARFAVHLSKYHQTSIRAYAALQRDLPRLAREFKCTWEGCDKTFDKPGLLEDHLNVHNNVYPYQCNQCVHKFRTRFTYRKHLSQEHQMSIRDLPEASSSAE